MDRPITNTFAKMDKPKANPLLGKESERCQEKKRSGGKLDTDQYIDFIVGLTDQCMLSWSQGWQTLIVLTELHNVIFYTDHFYPTKFTPIKSA